MVVAAAKRSRLRSSEICVSFFYVRDEPGYVNPQTSPLEVFKRVFIIPSVICISRNLNVRNVRCDWMVHLAAIG